MMMQKVLGSILVENPCRDMAQMPTNEQRAQLKPYDRAQEEATMGSFELEEGIRNTLVCLGDDCDFNLDELEEFNQNLGNVIRANNVNRGQNNIVSTAAAP